jgi:ABC-type hemin transport system substrate-binding protein
MTFPIDGRHDKPFIVLHIVLMRQFPPRRIVCLTEETVETLYLLGEQDRIVGVSGYAVRPPQVRREKPRVSAFISADIPKILKLEPDLVLAFSDLQADIVSDLVRAISSRPAIKSDLPASRRPPAARPNQGSILKNGTIP